MDREILLKMSSTAQVKILCDELLADGKPHTRKEIEHYIELKLKLLGIIVPSQGCISSGILQSVKKENCIKLGTGLYQLELISGENAKKERGAKAADCLQTAINTLTALTRTIDYVTADDSEIAELDKLKNCINGISKLRDQFQ